MDVILPTQLRLGGNSRGDPERRLQLAVLEDAVHQLERYANAIGDTKRALYEQELAWFASDDHSEPFSFASICDTLHIDAARVRARVWQWREGARSRVSRSPRRVSGPLCIGRRQPEREKGGEAAADDSPPVPGTKFRSPRIPSQR